MANILTAAVQSLVVAIAPKSMHGRIRIVCIEQTHFQEFLNVVTGALDMIARFDESRFKRIENQIRRIVYLPVRDGASYHRWLRVCVLDLAALKRIPHNMEIVPLVACVLVHEATHGYLCSRKVPFTLKISDRLELICFREMRRFADKAKIDQTPWD